MDDYDQNKLIIIIEDDNSNKNEQVSRLLQMPAGVSEHCSVVSQMIIFMMIVLLVNIVTMMAWNELNTVLLVVYLLTFQV